MRGFQVRGDDGIRVMIDAQRARARARSGVVVDARCGCAQQAHVRRRRGGNGARYSARALRAARAQDTARNAARARGAVIRRSALARARGAPRYVVAMRARRARHAALFCARNACYARSEESAHANARHARKSSAHIARRAHVARQRYAMRSCARAQRAKSAALCPRAANGARTLTDIDPTR